MVKTCLEFGFENFYQAISKGFPGQTNVPTSLERVKSSSIYGTPKSDCPTTPIHGHPFSSLMNIQVAPSSSEISRDRPETDIHTLSLAKISSQVYRQVYNILNPAQLEYLRVSYKGELMSTSLSFIHCFSLSSKRLYI